MSKIISHGLSRSDTGCTQSMATVDVKGLMKEYEDVTPLTRPLWFVCTEGVRLATRHQCKFVEISALLDHKVDELLVGIVRQIRLRQTRDEPVTADDRDAGGGGGGRLTTMIGGVLRRLVARATTPTRRRRRNDVASHPSLSECNNLFTPWRSS